MTLSKSLGRSNIDQIRLFSSNVFFYIMVIVMRGKNVKITAMPEINEDEKKTVDLVNKMKAELHKINPKDDEDDDD